MTISSWSHQHADGTWWKHPQSYTCPAKEFVKEKPYIFVYDPKLDWVGTIARTAVVEELIEKNPEAIYFFATISSDTI